MAKAWMESPSGPGPAAHNSFPRDLVLHEGPESAIRCVPLPLQTVRIFKNERRKCISYLWDWMKAVIQYFSCGCRFLSFLTEAGSLRQGVPWGRRVWFFSLLFYFSMCVATFFAFV